MAEVRKLNGWLDARLEKHHAEDLLELQEMEADQRLRHLEINTRIPISTDSLESVAPGESVKDRTDTIAMDINSEIQKYTLPQSGEAEFTSDRHALHIFDGDVGADLLIHSSDASGNQIILFIRDSDGHHGLTEQKMEPLREVLAILGAEDWARQRFGLDFVISTFIAWARLCWGMAQKSSYYDFIQGEAVKELGSLNIYYPIAHFEIETAFHFGPVIVAPITKAMFDSLEQDIALSPGEGLDDFKKHMQVLRKKVQGLAAIQVNIEAHPSVIPESAYELACDAVDILRFFSPMAPSSDSRCPMALKGSEFLPVKSAFAFFKNGFMRHDGLSEMFQGSWKLSESGLNKMPRKELSAASGLIDSAKLGGFSMSVRSGVILFSKGCALATTADRLRYTLAAAESVYLRHSFEHAGSLVSQRIADLVTADSSERKLVKDSIAKSYFLRNGHKDAYSSAELSAIRICTLAVHTAMMTSLLNVNLFSTRDHYIDALNHRAAL